MLGDLGDLGAPVIRISSLGSVPSMGSDAPWDVRQVGYKWAKVRAVGARGGHAV